MPGLVGTILRFLSRAMKRVVRGTIVEEKETKF
jgi:hypothetical protein